MGYPITRMNSTTDLGNVRQPRLFIQGGDDQFGSGSAMRELVALLREPKKLVVIEGADHFFTGRLDEIQLPIEEWAAAKPWSVS